MPELGTSDDVVLVVAGVAALLLLVAGIRERRRHRGNLARLPLRISVNGSRGKSTVTRLLTGALAAGGHRPLGKTTGTEARLIHGWDGTEHDVRRRPEGPNIGEQRAVLQRAVDEDADTMVAECMAVTPEYQVTFHRELLDVNLLVITNALDDHLDEMGPTAHDVADVFSATIPRGGTVAVVQGAHLERFRRVAADRGATLVVGDPSTVERATLDRFDHLVLAEHVALTLAVTRHLGIDDEVAVAGMLDAPPDPFATRLLPIGDEDAPALFVNAFPANDPVSTLAIWEHLVDRGHPGGGLTVIMNCREDRIERTQLFAAEVLSQLPIDTLIVTGASTRAVTRAVAAGRIVADTVHDLTGQGPGTVTEVLRGSLRERVILGVGNLHGGGAAIVAELEGHATDHLTKRGAA